MGFIPLRCPSCGAEIQLDDSREFGFCQYCGTKIVQDKVIVEHRGSVSLDRSDEVKNLLIRAEEKYQNNDLDAAENYYNRVLDIDARNPIAREKLNLVNSIVEGSNVFITRVATKWGEGSSKMKIIIDGQCQAKLKNGESASFRLSIGNHTITPRFSGIVKNEPTAIYIKDRYTKINLNFLPNIMGEIKAV